MSNIKDRFETVARPVPISKEYDPAIKYRLAGQLSR